MPEEPMEQRGKLNPINALGRLFSPKEGIYEALGSSMKESISDLSTQMADILGKQMADVVKQIGDKFEEQVRILSNAVKGVSREVTDDLIKKIDEQEKAYDRYSQEAIAKQAKRYDELVKGAELAKENMANVLANLDKDPNIKKVLAMMNFDFGYDTSAGKVLFDVGGKKISLEEITSEQIRTVAQGGQLTGPRDWGAEAEKYQGGIQQVTGIVQPLVAPTAQMMGMIAPNPIEQVQMGFGMAGGAAGTIGAAGMGMTAASMGIQAMGTAASPGLAALGGSLGAMGGILGPVGMIAGGVIGIAAPLIEAQMQKNYEREERKWRMGASGFGQGYGAEAGRVYEKYASEYYPSVPKEEIQALTQRFAALGLSADKLDSAVRSSGAALKGFGTNVQSISNILTYTYQGLGIAPEEVTEGAMPFQHLTAITGGVRGGEEQQTIFETTVGAGYQAGVGARMDDADFVKVMSMVSGELGRVGMTTQEIQGFVQFCLTGPYTIPILGREGLAGKDETYILSRMRQWIIKTVQTAPTAEIPSMPRGWQQAKMQMLGVGSPNGIQALARWARGESQEAFEKRMEKTGEVYGTFAEGYSAIASSREIRTDPTADEQAESHRHVWGGGLPGMGGQGAMAENELRAALEMSEEEIQAIYAAGGDTADKLRVTLQGVTSKNIYGMDQRYTTLPEARADMGITQRTGMGDITGILGSAPDVSQRVDVTVGFKEDGLSQLLTVIDQRIQRDNVNKGKGQAGSNEGIK